MALNDPSDNNREIESSSRLEEPIAPRRPSVADHPSVIAPPPVIVLVHLLAGILLELYIPVKILNVIFTTTFGWLLVLLAFGIAGLCILKFRRVGTNIQTRKPTTAIVTTGFYRFSRNPIYVSFVLLLMGLGISFNSLWIFLSVVPFIAIMNWGVISREEAYLEHKFGEDYLTYKSQVRRWL